MLIFFKIGYVLGDEARMKKKVVYWEARTFYMFGKTNVNVSFN